VTLAVDVDAKRSQTEREREREITVREGKQTMCRSCEHSAFL
jgi:hypothetical protein